jgi:hypothetical protein
MAPHGLVGLDMTCFDPVNDGFGRHIAELAGFKNGEYILHDSPLSLFIVIIVFLINLDYIVCQRFLLNFLNNL